MLTPLRSLALFCTFSCIVSLSSLEGSQIFSRYYPKLKTLVKAQEWKQALRLGAQILDSPDINTFERARLWYALSQIHRNAGNQDEALACAKRAMRAAPTSQKLGLYIRELTRKALPLSKRLANARERFETALESEKLLPGSAVSLFSEALPILREAVRKGLDPAFSNYALGICLLETGENAEAAESHLKRALSLNPEAKCAHCRLGIIALDNGKNKEALAHLVACESSPARDINSASAFIQAYATWGGGNRDALVLQLAKRVAYKSPNRLENLAELYPASKLKGELQKIAKLGKRAVDRTEAEANRASKAANTWNSIKKDAKPSTSNKKEKTAADLRAERYQAYRYRKYLDHLARLGKGQPSSWNEDIPKTPKKK